MRKQQNLLIAIILGAIETVLALFMTFSMLVVNNDNALKTEMMTLLREQGFNIESFGVTGDELMMGVLVMFLVIAVYSAIRLVFLVVAYRTNKVSYLITSICLCSVASATAIFFAGILGVIYEAVILFLVIFAYTKVRREQVMQATNINNDDNREKTVIDIEF